MTEEQWFYSQSPQEMFEKLSMRCRPDRTPSGLRKLRLLGVECCRFVIDLLESDDEFWIQVFCDAEDIDRRSWLEDCRRFLDKSEAYADGAITRALMDLAVGSSPFDLINYETSRLEDNLRFLRESFDLIPSDRPLEVASSVQRMVSLPGSQFLPDFRAEIELRSIAELIREVFGYPFQATQIDPSWLTSNVVELSKAIYNRRAFDRMPILSDALMDAGCDNEQILDHCRSATSHVRGCWVVDLLLGKS